MLQLHSKIIEKETKQIETNREKETFKTNTHRLHPVSIKAQRGRRKYKKYPPPKTPHLSKVDSTSTKQQTQEQILNKNNAKQFKESKTKPHPFKHQINTKKNKRRTTSFLKSETKKNIKEFQQKKTLGSFGANSETSNRLNGIRSSALGTRSSSLRSHGI